MSDLPSSEDQAAGRAAARAAVEFAYKKVVDEGACACCTNPVLSSINATENEIIWRCENSGCCCKLRYCCPYMFAHCLGITNCFLTICQRTIVDGKKKLEEGENQVKAVGGSDEQTEDYECYKCLLSSCVLLIGPILLVECIAINLNYYACCICCCPGGNEAYPGADQVYPAN
jgi:hypothetical protein